MLQNAVFGVTNDYIPNERVWRFALFLTRDMLLNKQWNDWWLETPWRSCGVTEITTPFRYHKWLRLRWDSVEVSLVQVMACRLFGAKPLPEPVEGPVIWNVMTTMLRPCNNNCNKNASCVYTNCKMGWSQGPHNGACGITIRVLFEKLSQLSRPHWPASGVCRLPQPGDQMMLVWLLLSSTQICNFLESFKWSAAHLNTSLLDWSDM